MFPIRICDIHLLVLIFIGTIAPYYSSIKKMLLLVAIVVIFITFLSKNEKKIIKTLLVTLMLPIDYLGYFIGLFCLLFLLLKYKIRINITGLICIIFIIYCYFCYIFSNIFIEGNILSYLFWVLTTATPFFVFIFSYNCSFSDKEKEELFQFFTILLWIQLFIVCFQVRLNFHPTDNAMASFGDAHKAGFYILILLLIHFNFFRKNFREYIKFKFIAIFIVLCLVSIACDAKALVLCIGIGTGLYLIFKSIKILSRILIKYSFKRLDLPILTFTFLLIAILFSFQKLANYYITHQLKLSSSLQKQFISYFLLSNPNAHKALYYKRIIIEFPKEYNSFFGTGPGTIGSKAANSRAYNTLAKSRQKIPLFIKPFTSTSAKKYLVDLYDQKFMENSSSRSSLLSYPFAFFTTMLAETGYLGVFLYLLFVTLLIFEITKKTKGNLLKYQSSFQIIWISLVLMFILDNYQEMPQIIMPLLILSAFLINKSNNCKKDIQLINIK